MVLLVCFKAHLITSLMVIATFSTKHRVEWNPSPQVVTASKLPGEIGLKRRCTGERVRIQLKRYELLKSNSKELRVIKELLKSYERQKICCERQGN